MPRGRHSDGVQGTRLGQGSRRDAERARRAAEQVRQARGGVGTRPARAASLGWQPVAILVLVAALAVCVVVLAFFAPTDDTDHVAAGDYVHAVGTASDASGSGGTAAGGGGGTSATTAGAPATVTTDSSTGREIVLLDEGRTTSSGDGRVSVAAFGSTIVGDTLLSEADAWDGTTGDGSYDFTPLYGQLSSAVAGADVAVTEEVGVLGGSDFTPSGYPLYDTPDSLADALAQAGFRVVNINNGHVLDQGTDAVAAAVATWGRQTGLLAVGSYASAEDAARVRVVECNGVRVAFLSFSTSASTYGAVSTGVEYLAVPATADQIASDVAAAREVADAVVVCMHWGNDGTHELSQEQQTYGQALADAGADVVVGCGSREVQRVAWLTGTGGNRTLVAYGLGALASGYTGVDQALSGMLSFDLVKASDGGVSVENATWHAVVEHRSGDVDCAYLLSDYTEELAAQNELLADETDAYASLSSVTADNVGTAVDVAD